MFLEAEPRGTGASAETLRPLCSTCSLGAIEDTKGPLFMRRGGDMDSLSAP